GFVYGKEVEQRSQGSWLGGFLVSRDLHPKATAVPPLRIDADEKKRLEVWAKRNRPDAIISTHPSTVGIVKNAGWQIPKELSVCLTVTHPGSEVGGMTFDSRRIGEIGAR